MPISCSDLAAAVHGELSGHNLPIDGPANLSDAGPNHVALVAQAKYVNEASASNAGGLITTAELAGKLAGADQRSVIVVKHPDAAWAKVLSLFAPPAAQPPVGVHPSAVIHPEANIGRGCAIGPHVAIGRARIGDGCILHAGVSIADDVSIANGCELFDRVVVRHRCTLGERCIVHPGAVIGADGFGYYFSGGRHHKIPHIGGVRIGNDVEIGANTTVDRAKLGDTVIGDGCKIDNLVQVAHNCRLGTGVILVSQVGIAGSVVIEDYAVLGGHAGVGDHVTIGKAARVGAFGAVMSDIPAGDEVVGVPAQDARRFFRQIAALRKLPDLIKEWRDLERRIVQADQPAKHD